MRITHSSWPNEKALPREPPAHMVAVKKVKPSSTAEVESSPLRSLAGTSLSG